MSNGRTYMVSLHITVEDRDEAVELTESLGTVFLGHVMAERDTNLSVTIFNEDGEAELEAEVDSDGGVRSE